MTLKHDNNGSGAPSESEASSPAGNRYPAELNYKWSVQAQRCGVLSILTMLLRCSGSSRIMM